MQIINFPETRFSLTETELERCIDNGVKKRFPKGLDDAHLKYLKAELKALEDAPIGWKMATLIVHHFLYDMKEKYPKSTSTGRGCLGGSLIMYLLKITEIDPVVFGLSFERLYAYAKISPIPSFDIDISSNLSSKFYDYLKNEYGEDYVFGCTIQTKRHKKCVHACAVFLSNTPYYEIGDLYCTTNLKILDMDRVECEKLGFMRINLVKNARVDKIIDYASKVYDDFSPSILFNSKCSSLIRKLPKMNDITLTALYEKFIPYFSDSFEDFILLDSLCRTSFTKFKSAITAKSVPAMYNIEPIDKILNCSYGYIVYQEQMNEILSYTLKTNYKNANEVRKGIEKNDLKMINNSFGKFVFNLSNEGFNYMDISKLWNDLLNAKQTTLKSHITMNAYDVLHLAYLIEKEQSKNE